MAKVGDSQRPNEPDSGKKGARAHYNPSRRNFGLLVDGKAALAIS